MTRACFYLQVPIYTHTHSSTYERGLRYIARSDYKDDVDDDDDDDVNDDAGVEAGVYARRRHDTILFSCCFVRSLIGRNCHDTAVVTATTERLADAALNACHLSACTYNIV